MAARKGRSDARLKFVLGKKCDELFNRGLLAVVATNCRQKIIFKFNGNYVGSSV